MSEIVENASGGKGMVIGKKAPDFLLADNQGGEVSLHEVMGIAPTLLVFYPGDFTIVCTSQLCNYRDHMEDFNGLGVQIFGVSHNPVAAHKKFAERYHFPFPLLSDPGNRIAKSFGCSSLLMLGGNSRAVFILNTQGIILYRYVEPTILTRRTADELLTVLKELRSHSLL